MNKIAKKVLELEVVEQLYDYCMDRAKWYQEIDDEGNVTYTSERQEMQAKAYLEMAEKLEKECTK